MSLLRILFFLAILLGSAQAQEQFEKISSQPIDDQYTIYYYFSFHCHACKTWSEVFEKDLENLQSENVRVVFSPVALDKTEHLLARGYILARQGGLKGISQEFFDLYRDSYFISDKKIQALVENMTQRQNKSSDIWSQQALLFAESKLKKNSKLAKDHKVRATPSFLITGPTGSYLVSPSERLHPTKIGSVLSEIVNEGQGASLISPG